MRSTTTEAVIATSDPVLQVASSHLSPPVPVDKLRSEVQVTLVTNYLLSFTATAGRQASPMAIANTVAQSYINYVDNERSPVSHVAAEMFQPVAGTSTSSRLEAMLIAGVIGALAGRLIGCVAALAIGRRDRRLSDRDRIANA